MQSYETTLRNFNARADIAAIFWACQSINWKEIRGSSIHRILYLSSVLYTFRTGKINSESPFSTYKFIIDNAGPYDQAIASSISFLLKDEYIDSKSSGETYILGSNELNRSKLMEIDGFPKREEWIRIVVFIMGIYTENRIYDFIFQDPEYQRVLKSGSQQGLVTEGENETTRYLNSFKEEFEKAISGRTHEISNQQYIEFYFEFIFGKIVNPTSLNDV